MTGFLASVNSLEEARIALAGGADVIDLKEPARGVLGAVPLATIREVVNFVAERRLVSATVGDMPADPAMVGPAVEETWASGVDLVKVGFFEPVNHHPLLNTLAIQAHKGTRIVAVLFADRELDFTMVRHLVDCGVAGVMLDTAEKQSRSLRNYRTDEELLAFVEVVKALGLMVGLAGSLAIDDITPLLPLKPDYLGFRGALCVKNQREKQMDPEAVHNVRKRIPSGPSKLYVPVIKTERKPAGFDLEEYSYDAVANQES